MFRLPILNYRAYQLNTAAVQLPIGLEGSHSGVVDVVCGRAFQFSGVKGENVEEIAVPDDMKVRARTSLSRYTIASGNDDSGACVA